MPRSAAGALEWIEGFSLGWQSYEVENNPTGTAFAIVEVASGVAVGMCGMDSWSSTHGAQFGYWLVEVARGRGLATRAVELMTAWLFELGAVRVVVTIESENLASAAVARRAGLVHEGQLQSHGDPPPEDGKVEVFAALRDEWLSGSH